MNPLTFSRANTKLRILAHHFSLPFAHVSSFDLPAGWSCPAADICKTKAHRETGKLERIGPVLCYAAKAEAVYPQVREMRQRNFEVLREMRGDVDQMFENLVAYLPFRTKILRIHTSGDFFRPEYFQAWVRVAEALPAVEFFGYTKILDYVQAPKPDNFHLIYSFGSTNDARWDASIPTCFIRTKVNTYPGIPVICDNEEDDYQDYDYIREGKSFALNLH